LDLPQPIVDFLDRRQELSNSPCGQCNAACCNGPGSALLENVLEIYKLYSSGTISREDFQFEQGLSFSQFVFRYFDRVVINNTLHIFFPKTVSETNGLNSVPPWNFWTARDYLKKRSMSLGCVFLAKKQFPNDMSNNYCLLHNQEMLNKITQKPIDCALLICNGIRNFQKPTTQESNMWFALLDYHFPNSQDRFKQMCPELVD
jgi:hypothetical protein